MDYQRDHETQGVRGVSLKQLTPNRLEDHHIGGAASARSPNLHLPNHLFKERRPTPTILPDPLRIGETASKEINRSNVSFKQDGGGRTDIGPKSDISSIPESLTFVERILSWRYVITVLLSMSWVVITFQKNSVPIALICMLEPASGVTSPLGHGSYNETGISAGFTGSNSTVGTARQDQGSSSYEFDWDIGLQGLILSSLFFTSFIAPLVGSSLESVVSPKTLITVSFGFSTVLVLLTPLVARLSPYAMIASRALQGVVQGGINVSVIGYYLARWAPASERLFMVTIVYSGVSFGSVVSNFVSGLLCSIPVDNGWPFIFYVGGGLSVLFCVSWHFLSYTSPEQHPFISEKEKAYILARRTGIKEENSKEQRTERPPYLAILSSAPVLAFLFTSGIHFMIINIIYTAVPLYFSNALEFSPQVTGVLMSIAALVRMAGGYMWSAISSLLVAQTNLNLPTIRKMVIFSGYLLACGVQVALGLLQHHDRWIGFAFVVAAMIFQAVGNCTLPTIPLDMAPKYAGLLSGLFVFVGNLVSIPGPIVVRLLTSNDLLSEWSVVWFLMSGLMVLAALSFLIFGQAKIQPWASDEPGKPMAHIVSPFVTMGRRFSALIEAPVFTPNIARRRMDQSKSVPKISQQWAANGEAMIFSVHAAMANENAGYVRDGEDLKDEGVGISNHNSKIYRVAAEEITTTTTQDDGLRFEHIPDIDDPQYEDTVHYSGETHRSGEDDENIELQNMEETYAKGKREQDKADVAE